MVHSYSKSWLRPLLCLSSLSSIYATRHSDISDHLYHGNDLARYITRPDIRSPLWNVTKHYPDEINPGYWFVSPYTDFNGPPDRTEYVPCQAGPQIYDGDGNLVWSGACTDHNRNVFDFRPFVMHNESHLSFVIGKAPESDVVDYKGMGMILNSSFQEVGRIEAPEEAYEFNLHEFQVIDDGKKVLMLASNAAGQNIYQAPNLVPSEVGHFIHDSVVEMDLASKSKDFQWWPAQHGISALESFDQHPPDPENSGAYWDFFHANSIAKTHDGDYIVSARHVNTIYKINRADSSVAWRLGGKQSDFLSDFNFSSQHDARVVFENSTVTMLTMMDNASDDMGRQNESAIASSAKMIALYTSKKPMKARLLKQWVRPDGRLTRKRGNVQILPGTANAWVCWSAEGFVSEHTQDGRVVMEARFASPRFDTYRAYKSDFVGRPSEEPVLKSFSFASDDATEHSMVISYVSWNGATEVKSWKFYGVSWETKKFVELGEVDKRGFETMFTSFGIWDQVYAEAFGVDGKSLGRSPIEYVIEGEDAMLAMPVPNQSGQHKEQATGKKEQATKEIAHLNEEIVGQKEQATKEITHLNEEIAQLTEEAKQFTEEAKQSTDEATTSIQDDDNDNDEAKDSESKDEEYSRLFQLGIAAVLLTLFTQAVMVGVYYGYKKYCHSIRGVFGQQRRSADFEEQSEPMLELERTFTKFRDSH